MEEGAEIQQPAAQEKRGLGEEGPSREGDEGTVGGEENGGAIGEGRRGAGPLLRMSSEVAVIQKRERGRLAGQGTKKGGAGAWETERAGYEEALSDQR